MKAMSADPENGFQIYLSHVMLDKMSNIIRDTFGTDNRDLAEILFNRTLKNVNNTQKLYKDNNPFINRYKNRFAKNAFEKKIKRNKFYRMNKNAENLFSSF